MTTEFLALCAVSERLEALGERLEAIDTWKTDMSSCDEHEEAFCLVWKLDRLEERIAARSLIGKDIPF